jgi:hypothetical protein
MKSTANIWLAFTGASITALIATLALLLCQRM